VLVAQAKNEDPGKIAFSAIFVRRAVVEYSASVLKKPEIRGAISEFLGEKAPKGSLITPITAREGGKIWGKGKLFELTEHLKCGGGKGMNHR